MDSREGRREKGEGRREKGEGRRGGGEKGEGNKDMVFPSDNNHIKDAQYT